MVSRSAAGLSRDRIFDAAVGVADVDGIDAVTMRRLAAELGAHPTSLYHHLPSKEAILDGLVERMFDEMRLASSFTAWQDWATGFAAGMRRAARAHPGAFLVLTRRPAVTTAAMRNTEGALEALTRAGLSLSTAADALAAVSLAVLGLALNECVPATAVPTVATVGGLDEFPMLRAAAGAASAVGTAADGPATNDAVWDLAVGMLVDGLKLLIAQGPGPRR